MIASTSSRDRVEQVLAVVDHDEGASIRQISVDAAIHRLGEARRRLQTERGRDCGIRRLLVGDGREVDEFGAVGEGRLRRTRRLDGEPRLPTASDSRERDDPVRVQFDGDCVQLPAPTDERRPGLGQAIASRLRRPQRRELRPQRRCRELVHAFLAVEPAQAVFAEIDPFVRRRERRDHARPDDLLPMRGVAQARGSDHLRTEVVAVALVRRAGVQSHAHPQRADSRPLGLAQRALCPRTPPLPRRRRRRTPP